MEMVHRVLALLAIASCGSDAAPVGFSPSSCVVLSSHACTKLALTPLNETIDTGDDFAIVTRSGRLELITMEPLGYYVRALEDGFFGPKTWLMGPRGTSSDLCLFAVREEALGAECLGSDATQKPVVYGWGADNVLAWTNPIDEQADDNEGMAAFGQHWIAAWSHGGRARIATFDAHGHRTSGPDHLLPPPATNDVGVTFSTSSCGVVITGGQYIDQQHMTLSFKFGFPNDPGKMLHPSTTFPGWPISWPYEPSTIAYLWNDDLSYVPTRITLIDSAGAERVLTVSPPVLKETKAGLTAITATSWGLLVALTESLDDVPYPPGHRKATVFIVGPSGDLATSVSFDGDGSTSDVKVGYAGGRALIGWGTLGGSKFATLECADP